MLEFAILSSSLGCYMKTSPREGGKSEALAVGDMSGLG
ncbi:hypothetical protein ACPOL_2554 [Acidisarcina polymorpha]|uniref:Uncharacterized protein n=1 Tax=Acidisarcina polymorpha TaxID=2211140 RepID=A0A2Z5FZB3_9BACT|nr:hypothetical protein ACPOL_2554 [Acidisarcina polymorpha]